MKDYLTIDEQFKKILDNSEVTRIKDLELRSIRQKYWNLLHDAFLDERNIPDAELGKEREKIKTQEKRDILEYINNHNIEYTLNW